MNNDVQLNQKEYEFSGMCLGGFFALFLAIALIIGGIIALVQYEEMAILPAIIGFIIAIVLFSGIAMLEPNESDVMIFFGKYKGTLRRTGLFWVNPFLTKRKMSLRINNLDVAPIKVNDRTGNPVMIGMVLVWHVDDTYRATFDVAATGDRHAALRNFVAIQSDAALREVAGHYAYDGDDDKEITLRSGGDVINEMLERKINERLAIAGVRVDEARLNYLAYAPEIAAVMLRRQQAAAIISAREKIVEGAVSMATMALNHLEEQNTVTLDNDRKATIIGNLLMVLCADESAQPVIPTNAQ